MRVRRKYSKAHDFIGSNLPIRGHCPLILVVVQDPIAENTPAPTELWEKQGIPKRIAMLPWSHLCRAPKSHPHCSLSFILTPQLTRLILLPLVQFSLHPPLKLSSFHLFTYLLFLGHSS